jgi:molecular chaperone DnaK
MAKVIGIDLGTTNTAVAVLEKGRPRVIEDDKGYKVLPSCVSAKPDGDFIVGQAARNKILTDPDRTVYAIKRLIGRRYDSQQAQEAKRRMPFRIDPAPDGGCLVQMGEHMYTPIEVCSIILQVAKQIAETALGDTVDEAVITVPAYFNHQQRSATFEAAKLAGLKCERLLNEPTAAALAFGFKKTGERTLALYDLGGGTFDISVLRLSSGVYEILATRGDTYLGRRGLRLPHRRLARGSVPERARESICGRIARRSRDSRTRRSGRSASSASRTRPPSSSRASRRS